MALGIQGRSANDYLNSFATICRRSFVPNPGTKHKLFGGLARWFHRTIYEGKNLKMALKDDFQEGLDTKSKSKLPEGIFGLESHTRVAVTATVEQETRLIANYHRESPDRYLESMNLLSKA